MLCMKAYNMCMAPSPYNFISAPKEGLQGTDWYYVTPRPRVVDRSMHAKLT